MCSLLSCIKPSKKISLILVVILIKLGNSSFGQVTYKFENIYAKTLLINPRDTYRTISDSTFGGKVTVEAEIDTISKTLQFKRFISGAVFRKNLNSKVYGYNNSRDKKLPQEFELIKPEIEKHLKLIRFEIPKDNMYFTNYNFKIEIK